MHTASTARRVGNRRELGADPGVHHVDLLRPGAEELDEVPSGALGIGQDQVRAADGAGHDGVQVAHQWRRRAVRIAHEGEIMDGEHAGGAQTAAAV